MCVVFSLWYGAFLGAAHEDAQQLLEQAYGYEQQYLFDKAIDKSSMNVEVTGLSPDEMPVTVTMDEFMRRMKDMSKMGGGGMMGFYGNWPDNYKVSVNGNHKLIKRMLETKD